MLGELKSLFATDALRNSGLLLTGLHNFIEAFEEELVDESARNALIDAMIKVLQSEKK